MTETKMPIHEILKVLQFHASCSQKCVKICILQRNAFVLNNMYKKTKSIAVLQKCMEIRILMSS